MSYAKVDVKGAVLKLSNLYWAIQCAKNSLKFKTSLKLI